MEAALTGAAPIWLTAEQVGASDAGEPYHAWWVVTNAHINSL